MSGQRRASGSGSPTRAPRFFSHQLCTRAAAVRGEPRPRMGSASTAVSDSLPLREGLAFGAALRCGSTQLVVRPIVAFFALDGFLLLLGKGPLGE